MFAVVLKNQIRPLGLHVMGFPCLLTGTGMAFPWEIIQAAPLAGGNIVEDMALGLEMALGGSPPKVCSAAHVEGDAAPTQGAAKTQRTRWEHGHMKSSLKYVPKLLLTGMAKARISLLGLAAEMLVPPVSLLLLVWGVVALLGLVWWAFCEGSVVPGLVVLGAGGLAGVAIFASWCRYGRSILPFRTLLAVPFYILWKTPIYLRFIVSPQKDWVRTRRANEQ
jgi:cellulose synthase/poly-beta-1,6-N-acetylglucosamine synthase-like glycosyltransferase